MMEQHIQLKLGYDPNITMPKYKAIYVDTDTLDAEIIHIKRNGRTLTFPIWEFWQTLEKYNDCEGCDFY
jgi:hypothetical protein